MDILSDRVVLNAEDHSLIDYPYGLRMVFGYLSGMDLINCLLVNKTFYNQIVTSDVLMKKIVIKIPRGANDRASYLLSQTDRSYKNIWIQSETEYEMNFLNDHFKWKSVHLKYMKFCPEMWSFLQQFTETVAELNFTKNNLDLSTDEKVPIFKKLHTLKIINKQSKSILIFDEFINNYDTIKHLTISQLGLQIGFDYIKNMKGIQLESLLIIRPKPRYCITNEALNTQKHCLKELTMFTINTTSMMYIWEVMTGLRKLTMGAKAANMKVPLTLKTNTSITEIVIDSSNLPVHIYQKMVKATPNLRFLHVTNKNHLRRCEYTVITYTGQELRERLQGTLDDNFVNSLFKKMNYLRLKVDEEIK